MKILNKCILSILVYNLFLDRQRNIVYTPQYFHTPAYWLSSWTRYPIFLKIRLSDWALNRLGSTLIQYHVMKVWSMYEDKLKVLPFCYIPICEIFDNYSYWIKKTYTLIIQIPFYYIKHLRKRLSYTLRLYSDNCFINWLCKKKVHTALIDSTQYTHRQFQQPLAKHRKCQDIQVKSLILCKTAILIFWPVVNKLLKMADLTDMTLENVKVWSSHHSIIECPLKSYAWSLNFVKKL